MSVFHSALKTIFYSPMAEAVVYTPLSGPAVTLRMIARQPDEIIDIQGVEINQRSCFFDILASELNTPARGDSFVFRGESFKVVTYRKRDSDRLIWTLEAVPV